MVDFELALDGNTELRDRSAPAGKATKDR